MGRPDAARSSSPSAARCSAVRSEHGSTPSRRISRGRGEQHPRRRRRRPRHRPSCTRPRAGPSRGGARDAPRDGNAAKMRASHTVQGCRTDQGRGGCADAPDVRRAVSVEPCPRRPPPRCAVVGGGPGGVVLAYLLARAGVPVTLLESRPDFDRRFRGDALAPPVLEVLDDLGLADPLLAAVPHGTADAFVWRTPTRAYRLADYRRAEREVPVLRAGPAGPVPAVRGAGGRPLPGIPRRDGGAGVRAARDGGRRRRPRRGAESSASTGATRPARGHRHRARCAPDICWYEVPRRDSDPPLSGWDHRRARRLARGPRPGRQLAAGLPDPRGDVPGAARRRYRAGGRGVPPAAALARRPARRAERGQPAHPAAGTDHVGRPVERARSPPDRRRRARHLARRRERPQLRGARRGGSGEPAGRAPAGRSGRPRRRWMRRPPPSRPPAVRWSTATSSSRSAPSAVRCTGCAPPIRARRASCGCSRPFPASPCWSRAGVPGRSPPRRSTPGSCVRRASRADPPAHDRPSGDELHRAAMSPARRSRTGCAVTREHRLDDVAAARREVREQRRALGQRDPSVMTCSRTAGPWARSSAIVSADSRSRSHECASAARHPADLRGAHAEAVVVELRAQLQRPRRVGVEGEVDHGALRPEQPQRQGQGGAAARGTGTPRPRRGRRRRAASGSSARDGRVAVVGSRLQPEAPRRPPGARGGVEHHHLGGAVVAGEQARSAGRPPRRRRPRPAARVRRRRGCARPRPTASTAACSSPFAQIGPIWAT